MEKIDFSKVPKQFCENISVGFTKEFFVMAMFSGTNAITYALTPEHTKRLYEYLAHNMEKYEEQYGKIEAKWESGILSPIQSSDFPGNGKNAK